MALHRRIAGFILIVAGTRPAHATEETLTLARALELGRERAFSLKAARHREQSADADIDQKSANYFPTLSTTLTGGANTTRDTQVLPPPRTGLFSYVNSFLSGTGTASLRWTAYDFGRTSGAVAASRESHVASVDDVADAELGVLRDVANAYVTLHYDEALRDVAEVTLEQREHRVVIARGLIRSGLLPPVEEIRTRARADAARLDLVNAEANVADSRASLASLLQIDPVTVIKTVPPRLKEFDGDVGSAARAADALPSVRSALASARSKVESVGAAQARYLPTIAVAVDGTYRYARYEGASDFTNTRSAVGSLVVSIPLLDFSIAPGVREARADASAALQTAKETRRTSRAEAARATISARATSVAVVQARAAATEAGAVLAVVDARYRDGLASPIELIDAEGADSDARVALTQAELSHALALVRAAIATGRGLVEAP